MKKSQINIPIARNISLQGNLSVPGNTKSLIIFSHGSARSRFSSRNRMMANMLNKQKNATLLIDLLTDAEDSAHENRFNIDLLSDRLIKVISYTGNLPELKNLPVGFFGAGTGTASALQAAGKLGDRISALVSRSGRPDLAGNLELIKIPSLLIVGSLDHEMIRLNEWADSQLVCEKKLQVIDGASHLFTEPGKLLEITKLAAGWFNKYLVNSTITSKEYKLNFQPERA